MLLRTIQTL